MYNNEFTATDTELHQVTQRFCQIERWQALHFADSKDVSYWEKTTKSEAKTPDFTVTTTVPKPQSCFTTGDWRCKLWKSRTFPFDRTVTCVFLVLALLNSAIPLASNVGQKPLITPIHVALQLAAWWFSKEDSPDKIFANNCRVAEDARKRIEKSKQDMHSKDS